MTRIFQSGLVLQQSSTFKVLQANELDHQTMAQYVPMPKCSICLRLIRGMQGLDRCWIEKSKKQHQLKSVVGWRPLETGH